LETQLAGEEIKLANLGSNSIRVRFNMHAGYGTKVEMIKRK
jgi:hypothetical protein